VIDWLFRNRHTGRITVAQFPNPALWAFLAGTLVLWAFDPAGGVRAAFRVLAAAGLLWWAVDELLRGVNPWRRLLGGAVLAGQVLGYLR
jgi:hypothetical protein